MSQTKFSKPEFPWKNPQVIQHTQGLLNSFQPWTGRSLLDNSALNLSANLLAEPLENSAQVLSANIQHRQTVLDRKCDGMECFR